MDSVTKIAEPFRQALKQRLVNAAEQANGEDVERQLSTLEHMLATQSNDAMVDGTAFSRAGNGVLQALEEFILDTRAYADYSLKLGRFLHYQPSSGPTPQSLVNEGASGWIARQLKLLEDPQIIARVSRCLPAQPVTYRMGQADRDALVQRISARKRWRQTLVEVWVGEMERFLAMKAFMLDTDASKLSPSGYVDAMWHELILDTRLYDEHCHLLLGKFIHHNPDGAMDSSRAERYSQTLACYQHLFQQQPCILAWESAEEANAHQ